MQRTSIGLFLLSAALLLAACGRSAITPRPNTPTPVPELNVTRVPATNTPVLPSQTETLLPAITPTQPATDVPPTETLSPTAAATNVPPTLTATLPPSVTPTRAVIPTRAGTRIRPTPTSSGPLTVAVYVANCRKSPTPGKPGNVTVQISIEAAGGNGVYYYFNQGVESPTKFVDILWERGSRLTGTVKVVSGDGQEVKKVYDIPIGELTCP